MADKRAYFKLDIGYLTNPKVASVAIQSASAALLHIGSIAYSAQHLTDGVVPVDLVLRLTGGTKDDAALLIGAGLWVDLGGGLAAIHDYLEHQRSSADAKGAVEKARKAADTRWHPTEDDASMPPSMPTSMPRASESVMPRERERKKEITTLSLAAATDDFEAFWEAYPRKDAKGKARIAYRAAAKKVSPSRILASLKAQLPGRTFEKPVNGGIDYRPLPASWLNAERWADEIRAVETGPRDQWARAIYVGPQP